MLELLTKVDPDLTYSCGPGDFQFEGIFPKVVSIEITVIKIGVPILLIILGMIDLGKAVVAQKEEEIKKGQGLFIKRLISALLVFLVVFVVQIAVRFIAGSDNSKVSRCIDCFVSGKIDSSGKTYTKDDSANFNDSYPEGCYRTVK